jgi:uncharacterized protein (DUF885 family)
MADADAMFSSFARSAVGGLLERRPELATLLGEHSHDGRLTVGTAGYYEELARWCAGRMTALAAIDVSQLSPEYRADARILASQLESCQFAAAELREHEWNPMLANPGRAIYLLTARDFAPLDSRLRSVAARLAAVPHALAAARAVAGEVLPRVHLETAISQFSGTERLITAGLDQALAGAPEDLAAQRSAALEAIREHHRWLEQRLADGTRDGRFGDPRIGPDLFARKLRLTLETPAGPEDLLARAEADLDRATSEITETAARLAGGNGAVPPAAHAPAGLPAATFPAGAPAGLVRRVLDSLAADAPDDRTILRLVQRAYDGQLAFVREHGLVTAYDDPVEVIEMPEIDRGVAVAYCDPPGPLETAGLPTFVAVSPAPREWGADQVRSFYREYNRHMVQNLMVHEAMPGHVLQLAHARRFTGGTPVRAAFWSGSFVEGWAVYAEELMAAHGYPGERSPGAVRMQQLKMQLRTIINTILDIRVHCAGLPEAEAMALMTRRGFQEDGEAAGKWRRALLTSAQLSTYYVGYTEVSDLVAGLRAARPGWTERQVHDEVLAHGSPAVRHLRDLLAG